MKETASAEGNLKANSRNCSCVEEQVHGACLETHCALKTKVQLIGTAPKTAPWTVATFDPSGDSTLKRHRAGVARGTLLLLKGFTVLSLLLPIFETRKATTLAFSSITRYVCLRTMPHPRTTLIKKRRHIRKELEREEVPDVDVHQFTVGTKRNEPCGNNDTQQAQRLESAGGNGRHTVCSGRRFFVTTCGLNLPLSVFGVRVL